MSQLHRLLSRHAHLVAALVPPAYLVFVVIRYAVAVPYRDQWELVPLLDKLFRGGLTFRDIYAQYNEHRIFFPKLIMLGLARLTGWQIGYELAINVLLGLSLFAIVARQLSLTRRRLGVSELRWAIPASSVAVFSIAQYQNWLWGWQITMLLNLLAVVGGIVLLANPVFGWWRFAGAAVLGLVATHSFANGVLFWPIGLLILTVVTAGKPQRNSSLIAWVLVSAAALTSFLWDYHKSPNYSLTLPFSRPVEYAAYVLRYLGSVCAQVPIGDAAMTRDLSLVLGLGAIATLTWACWLLRRWQMADLTSLLPYLGLSAYSIGGALLTGVGRICLGSGQAISSRYCTMTVPLCISLIVLLILLAKGRSAGAAPGQPATRQEKEALAAKDCSTLAQWLAVGAGVLLGLTSLLATAQASIMSQVQAYGKARLMELAASPSAEVDYRGLSVLYGKPGLIVEQYPVLVRNRLSVFQDPGAHTLPH
jgi:hypothetical protein